MQCDKRCKSCIYRSTTGTYTCCLYIIYEGKRRGCDAGKNCDKYIHATRKELAKRDNVSHGLWARGAFDYRRLDDFGERYRNELRELEEYDV